MEKLYYSISEVAKELGENTSCIRYWSDAFSKFVKPNRNAKGNRMYKAEDIQTLRQIQHLVNVKGLKLEGVEKELRADHSTVDKAVKALTSLKEIRSQLVQVRELL